MKVLVQISWAHDIYFFLHPLASMHFNQICGKHKSEFAVEYQGCQHVM